LIKVKAEFRVFFLTAIGDFPPPEHSYGRPISLTS
jgi:hypothetical protein